MAHHLLRGVGVHLDARCLLELGKAGQQLRGLVSIHKVGDAVVHGARGPEGEGVCVYGAKGPEEREGGRGMGLRMGRGKDG